MSNARHHRDCPHCEEPMEYYPGQSYEMPDGDIDDEPNIYSCPECGFEEEE